MPGSIRSMHLEHVLRNVQTDRGSLLHGRLLRWQFDTVTLAHRCRRGASTPSPIECRDRALFQCRIGLLRGLAQRLPLGTANRRQFALDDEFAHGSSPFLGGTASQPDYRRPVKYGITSRAKRRIEASALPSGTILKLTCNEACSYEPKSCCVRRICAMISSGAPTHAAQEAIWSAARDWRSFSITLS